ncbi:hypothetical protein AD998_14060 [bacterium 336/3]|nr:hypothetical protein AD998_14060 [bacterium 336/3]
MQIKNFSINDDFISLNYQGKHFDLHNNFELTNIISNQEQKTICFIFTKGNGNWIRENSPNCLMLLFKNVTQVYYKDHDINYPLECIPQDQFTINMLGFSFGDSNIMNGVTDNVPKEDLPALLFVLETGKAIKIVAESVELFIE